MTITQIIALRTQAASFIADLPVERLVELFEETERQSPIAIEDAMALAEVRGWIMDAMEQRAPKAFARWLDGAFDDSPRAYFVEG